jgi:diketogulonate reductase-like aldo/keto reductase
MQTIELSDGNRMPVLGLGVYLVSDVAVCERSVETALRAGYRLVDTATAYRNERAVGRGIRASGVRRDEVFVTTKIWVSDTGYEKTRAAIGRSVERLGTGYLDLLLLHQPFGDVLGSWRALEEAVRAGTVRSIGVSNFQEEDLAGLLPTATIRPAVDQVELHPYFQQRELREVHARHGIVTEAWSPLAQGKAVGDEAISRIANAHGKSPGQVVIRWHLQIGNVVIPKSVTPKRIEENFDLFDFELTEAEMEKISQLDRGERIGPDPDTFVRPPAR